MSLIQFRTRSPVLSTKSMVCTSQPLASAIGNQILAQGGNCCDAAIAIAAALAVTEPCSTGIGGDMFALYYDAKKRKVYALNGSGKSARGATFSKVKSTFPNEFKIPRSHGMSVTVPGCVAGWEDAMKAWGTKSLKDVLKPAIELAREGFPCSEVTAYWWGRHGNEQLEPGKAGKFLPAPTHGQLVKNEDLADTLELISKHGRQGFYEGKIAKAICEAVQAKGGLLTEDDLKAHTSVFAEPVKMRYREQYDIYECPPNGQGLVALMALDAFQQKVPDVSTIKRNSAAHLHLMIECLRSGFADARKFITDPEYMKLSPDELLLGTEHRQKRLKRINVNTVETYPEPGSPFASSETVSFQVVDPFGNAFSMVNSTFEGFGSGICPEGTGMSLQNRASNFSLDETSSNRVDGAKRPYHTIIPGMVLNAKDASLHASFTVMGAFMQPQGHMQVLHNLLDFGDSVQQALDRPRFCILAGQKASDNKLRVALEEGLVDTQTEDELKTVFGQEVFVVRGHDRSLFGRGQIIQCKVDGNSKVLAGGSDPRADGCAIPGV